MGRICRCEVTLLLVQNACTRSSTDGTLHIFNLLFQRYLPEAEWGDGCDGATVEVDGCLGAVGGLIGWV